MIFHCFLDYTNQNFGLPSNFDSSFEKFKNNHSSKSPNFDKDNQNPCKFFSNNEISYPNEEALTQGVENLTPINQNNHEIAFISPIESRKRFFHKSSYDDNEENESYDVSLQKKHRKNVRLMLNSRPFKSPGFEIYDNNRQYHSYNQLIDCIKEEPIEKSPHEFAKTLENDDLGSFHSIDQPKGKKNLKLFVPLSNSFHLFDSNEDSLEKQQLYPDNNDEILLKKLPNKPDGLPEVISRTPSPLADEKKPPYNVIPNEKKQTKLQTNESLDDEPFLKLLPLEDEREKNGEGSNFNCEKESTDSEYDNYHKCFDNMFLLQDKKSNEEERKSNGSNAVLNESLDKNHNSFNNSINHKAKTELDINNAAKISKQLTFLQKIEMDIQKNVDSNYQNTIKNIDNLINYERHEHKHLTLPANFMNSSCHNISETSQTMTPLNFMSASQNLNFFASPSPSSHFDRFLFNEDNFGMTHSANFQGFDVFLEKI